MKIRLLIYLALASGIMLTGCEKDNYEPPSSTLEGQVVYNGEPIGLKSDRVELELWQVDNDNQYELFTKIPVWVDQDGSFSAVLFDGDYKMVTRGNNGPWVNNRDSVDVQVRGNTIVDMPVTPFYTIKAQEYTRSGNIIRGYFDIEEVAGEEPIEAVNLFIGTSVILDDDNKAAGAKLSGGQASFTEPNVLDVDLGIAELAGRDYVFARGAVKVAGVAEMIYTPVVKIILNQEAAQ